MCAKVTSPCGSLARFMLKFHCLVSPTGVLHTSSRKLSPGVELSFMRRSLLIFMFLVASVTPVTGQESTAAKADYLSAVASFFSLPSNEVSILSEWEIPADEIPVVLFVARRSGVSPEALVALRQAGRSWSELTARYGVGSSALHVPVPDDAHAGALERVYNGYRSTPVARWGNIRLSHDEVVDMVNVRLISQSLGLPAARVIGETETGTSHVDLYARLRG